ncbi:RAMP superfamily CRISPR-associated protein [Algoriphagus formosus]|uniref:RAMP superfamily CRISPR-associated protein n=1 Tax=Algoriphagus formosus TaxID=2007308 RepID=UPI000C28633B|nr:RAMP superfamily CRISPR-associated protein [Algoriphagus formosus]
MKSIIYKIEFFTYWHIGSGITGGTYADNLVLKDSNNLPYIPGRTMKGLFREASEEIARLNKEMISSKEVEIIFGKREGHGMQDESCAFFKDAVISRSLAEKILENSQQETLYEVISSTKIDLNGLADDGSLRQMEVTVPLTLFGTIVLFKDVAPHLLTQSVNWVKSLGLNRNRGLGRCQISIL